MKTILLISTLCIIGLPLKAQKVDLESMYSSVEIRFKIKLDTVNLWASYILNGIPYLEEEFKVELRKYRKSDIKFTAIADFSTSFFFHRNCDYLILVVAGEYNQSKKSKLKELDSIRSNLNENLPEIVIRDYICESCKQVVVDGIPIGMYEARTLTYQLKPKNIDFIVSYKSANPRIFGRNSINGLTEIFLKKKADIQNY